MKYSTSSVGGTVEILASSTFQSIPAKISGTEAVKAGMPITAAGAPIKAGTGAVGILLYDVDPTVNPNCALVVSGIVDWTKCKANSGATATGTAMKGILPGSTFRDDIKVQTPATDDGTE